jgi:phage tail sheath protein FI
MAETLLSPGVLTRENDQSPITQGPVTAGAAIIGQTVKGPVNIPTLVTSYSSYLSKFGGTFISGGTPQEYLTSISAFNYFQQGGSSLLVSRVVSGSFTPATSTAIYSNAESGVLKLETDSLLSTTYSVTASVGTNVAVGATGSLSGVGATITVTLNSTSSVSSVTVINGGTGFVPGELLIVPSGSLVGGTSNLVFTLTEGNIVNNEAFTLETLSEGEIMNSTSTLGLNGALPLGSSDNLRFEIVNVNTGSGIFNLLIRKGNDTNNSKSILESWSNLSLDPNQPNYITAVIGNQSIDTTGGFLDMSGDYINRSAYVRIKSVANNTINYFDNNGVARSEMTSSIPYVQSGTFGGAVGALSGIYTLPSNEYTSSLNLLSNSDEFKYNVITIPGVTQESNSPTIALLIANTSDRGDAIAIVDLVNESSTLASAIAKAGELDNSYAATYWPWVQVNAPQTGKLTFVPASTIMPSVFAFNDRVAAPWFAPAGFTRGALSVIQAKRKLSPADKDSLYAANVNAIGTFPGQGVVAYGQKTLQKKASATDRINVRRLLIELKGYIGQVANTLVFEQNSNATRNRFLAQTNPYLDSIKQREGLFAYKVVMDDSNNTADVIDRNQLVGQIFIQPTRTAEFIILDFNVTPTGATF